VLFTCTIILVISFLTFNFQPKYPSLLFHSPNTNPHTKTQASQQQSGRGHGSFIGYTTGADPIPIYNASIPTSPPRFLNPPSGFPSDQRSPSELDSPFSSSTKIWDTQVTTHHPRLFAPPQRWKDLPQLIADDPYLARWNSTIFTKATEQMSRPPVIYSVDGTSGVLDVAREVQLQIKYWAYAYRMGDGGGDEARGKWKERIWKEIVVASGNVSEVEFGRGGDNWNSE